jgi:hypothetical protein
VGIAEEGACAAAGKATGSKNIERATAGTKMCILRFPFTKTSSILDAAQV